MQQVLFPTVGAVVIRGNRQEPDVVAVSVRGAATYLRDAQRIEGVYTCRGCRADNFFPLQTIVSIELRPGQLSELLERVQSGMAIGFLQVQQTGLKNRVVEV